MGNDGPETKLIFLCLSTSADIRGQETKDSINICKYTIFWLDRTLLKVRRWRKRWGLSRRAAVRAAPRVSSLGTRGRLIRLVRVGKLVRSCARKASQSRKRHDLILSLNSRHESTNMRPSQPYKFYHALWRGRLFVFAIHFGNTLTHVAIYALKS